MKVKNYKQLLREISKSKQVILTISLWTYSSKRMVFKVPFDQVEKWLDSDMLFEYSERMMKFTSIDGKDFISRLNKLKISKVDYVEIV